MSMVEAIAEMVAGILYLILMFRVGSWVCRLIADRWPTGSIKVFSQPHGDVVFRTRFEFIARIAIRVIRTLDYSTPDMLDPCGVCGELSLDVDWAWNVELYPSDKPDGWVMACPACTKMLADAECQLHAGRSAL